MKYVIGGVTGFFFAVAAMFFSNPTFFTGTLPTMSEGAYRVYSVKPSFDNRGNSVFWITASRLKERYLSDIGVSADIGSDEVKLYTISRSRVIDPTTFEKFPSPMAGNKIKVLAGTAMVASR